MAKKVSFGWILMIFFLLGRVCGSGKTFERGFRGFEGKSRKLKSDCSDFGLI